MKRLMNGCREYNTLSRRQFLVGSAKAALVASTASAWLPKFAFAKSDDPQRDVLISIFLRGGADGLTTCVPHADDNYYAVRPNIAVPRPDSNATDKATDLDGFFGLAPGMVPLLEAYQSGHLAIVHATGSTDPSRSHFDAQKWMELGVAQDPNTSSGWLGRHIASSQQMLDSASLRAIGMTYGMPLTLQGGPKTLPIPDVTDFRLAGYEDYSQEVEDWLAQAYDRTSDPVRAAAVATEQTLQMLRNIDFDSYQPSGGAVYPDTDFGRGIKASAAVMNAEIGVEAIHLDVDGWDTHSEQGSTTGGLNELMLYLSTPLQALHTDLFTRARTNFTLVVLSEFGRNVGENDSRGTDHGHGNAIFVMGGSVLGGEVIRQWPGLAEENLNNGVDLEVTIDYRDVLGEIIQKRLHNNNLDVVFPTYSPTFRGLFPD